MDRAAVGGIEKYAAAWAGRIPADPDRQAALAKRVAASFRGYAALAPAQRRRVVGSALAALDAWSRADQHLTTEALRTAEKSGGGGVDGRGEGARRRTSSSNSPGEEAARRRLEEIPVVELKGVGAERAAALGRVGIRSVDDLLRYRPRAYQDRRVLTPIGSLRAGREATVQGKIVAAFEGRVHRLRWTDLEIADETGELHAIFYGQPWLVRRFRPGDEAVLSGDVRFEYGQLRMNGPDFETRRSGEAREREGIVPLYPLTEGVSQRMLRWWIHTALENYGARAEDWLRAEDIAAARMISNQAAFRRLHAPEAPGEEVAALDRLAFDEVVLLQLASAVRRRTLQSLPGIAIVAANSVRARFDETLPFTFTLAQRRAASEIGQDMASGRPMNRLLQGDVGSGKTVVAVAAIASAAGAGWQSAFMAPTEILAAQHARTLARLLEPAGLRVVRLTAAVKAVERRRAIADLASGAAHVAVGTHALLESDVAIPRLALAVVDEQHRFGVLQRARLREKARTPHVLVMTATPIPRTLAMTLFGDLDVSVLDERPPGRRPIETLVLHDGERAAVVGRVTRELAAGRQAYIVHPLVEANVRVQAKAAAEGLERWREALPGFRVELLHGRQRPAEKDAVMEAFAAGEVHALVATTVVEVGVDVANATVMVVENAERFGLSSLHQLRGRVGRGEHPSVCLLVASEAGGTARGRLRVLASTQDGFRIAEEDLKIRGPGELFGTRQHGDEAFPDLPAGFGRGFDARILAPARRLAAELLERDPALSQPEHLAVRTRFDARYGALIPLANVG